MTAGSHVVQLHLTELGASKIARSVYDDLRWAEVGVN